MTAYEDFLRAKVRLAEPKGFEVEPSAFNPLLKPHQRAIATWLVRQGRAACFAAFGLGKSVMQLEVVRVTRDLAGGYALITIPLGVRQEFYRDAAMLGITVRFIRSFDEVDDPATIYLTNYETVRDGKLDPRRFSVASLDEASCLRGFGGSKTFREFMALFAGDDRAAGIRGDGVRYRYVATATPSQAVLCHARPNPAKPRDAFAPDSTPPEALAAASDQPSLLQVVQFCVRKCGRRLQVCHGKLVERLAQALDVPGESALCRPVVAMAKVGRCAQFTVELQRQDVERIVSVPGHDHATQATPSRRAVRRVSIFLSPPRRLRNMWSSLSSG